MRTLVSSEFSDDLHIVGCSITIEEALVAFGEAEDFSPECVVGFDDS